MNPAAGMFTGIPTVIKNLLIINGLMFLLKLAHPFGLTERQLNDLLGLHYFSSPLFKPWQLLTHMFMHGNTGHLVMNMLGLFMLGPRVEYRWGSQRFLLYYLLCGFGAALLYMGWLAFGAQAALSAISPEDLTVIKDTVVTGSEEGLVYNFPQGPVRSVYQLYRISMVGASGALFGVMVAFGMLYPNVELLLLFFPVPIKAKWFVVMYAAFELFSGVARIPGDNIAHFAHLGGMVAGFFLVRAFERRNTFYDNPWR